MAHGQAQPWLPLAARLGGRAVLMDPVCSKIDAADEEVHLDVSLAEKDPDLCLFSCEPHCADVVGEVVEDIDSDWVEGNFRLHVYPVVRLVLHAAP